MTSASEAAHPASILRNAATGQIEIGNLTGPAQVRTGNTTSTFWSPAGIAVDPKTDEVLVANAEYTNPSIGRGGFLAIFNGSTDQLERSVTPGTGTWDAAYDGANGDFYVTNSVSGNVSVYNLTTNQFVAAIDPKGCLPYANATYYDLAPSEIAYDGTNGDLYATLTETVLIGSTYHDCAGVEVINGSSNQVTADIPLNGTSPQGIAWDSANHLLYVTDGSVVAINGSSHRILATISSGSEPWGVVFDPANRLVYVANEGSNNVSAINGTTDQVVASIATDAGPAGLAYDPLNGDIAVSDFSASRLEFLNTTTDSSVANFSVGAQPSTVAYIPPFGQLFLSHTSTNSVTVLAPVNGSIAITPGAAFPETDVGFATNWTAKASGGAGAPRFSWAFGDGTSANTSTGRVPHAYGKVGQYSVVETAYDALGASASTTVGVLVVPAPVVSQPRGSTASVDGSGEVSFSVQAAEGVTPYVRYHWSGLAPGNCTGTATPFVTCTFVSPGDRSISASVTDWAGMTSSASEPLSFPVFGVPVEGAPTPSRSSVDLGQPVTFVVQTSNGSGGYVYAWSGLPPGCSGNGPAVSCVPEATGTFIINSSASDSNGGSSVVSPSLDFAVYSDPSVSISSAHPMIDEGQSLQLQAEGSGGSGGPSYEWSGLPPGCSVSGSPLDCTPSAPGTFVVRASMTDSDNGSAISTPLTLFVAVPLEISAAVLTGSGSAGGNWTFEALSEGGTGPVHIAWAFGDGTEASGELATHSYALAGAFDVRVWANDSTGASSSGSLVVHVSAGELVSSPPSNPAPSLASVALSALGLGLFAGAAVLYIGSRRSATRGPSAGPPGEDRASGATDPREPPRTN